MAKYYSDCGGAVVSGPTLYDGLICNITVRADGTDWRSETEGQANFQVGSSIASRNHEFDFRHPEGVIVAGYPVIGRFGSVRALTPSETETVLNCGLEF